MSEESPNDTNGEPPRAAPDGAEEARRIPSLFRNYISFAGTAVVVASLACILLLFLIEITGGTDNPYLGIFTYVIFPAVMFSGFGIILLGMYLERRRRLRSPAAAQSYPVLDLNDPRRRRAFLVFLAAAFVFVFMSAFGSYRAYEHSESVAFRGETCHTVMEPEFVTFQVSPHARLHCVDCHVGSGAEWYLRSKLNGARQLYAVAFDTYSRPIASPVHNMRPARDTCGQCHWSERFVGDRLKVFDHVAYDEGNTRRQTRMLLKVGGGDPETGEASGIHWHMNLANEITFISTDHQRQEIPWVRMKDARGQITEYTVRGAQLSREQIEKSPKRTMDCIDCHNRPTHIFLSPDAAVDRAFVAGKLDASLPYLKREAVAALTKPYATTGEALGSIAASLDQFYRTNYSDVHAQRRDAINGSIAEVQRIYRTYFFPVMKTDWRAHPDNNNHFNTQGCFRCHDGQHVSPTGKVISNDCNICHTTLDQTEGNMTFAAQNGAFRHPVELGDLSGVSCTICHKGAGGFRHPINLGDISQFRCVDCHAGKVWGRGDR